MGITDKTKKIFSGIGIIIGIVLFAYFKNNFTTKPTFDKELMAMASEVNKTCPIMINNETRLENTVALPDKIFQYNFTILSTEKKDMDIETTQTNTKKMVLSNVKTSPSFKTIRENNITMSYSYQDKNGVFLFKFSITPDEYNDMSK